DRGEGSLSLEASPPCESHKAFLWPTRQPGRRDTDLCLLWGAHMPQLPSSLSPGYEDTFKEVFLWEEKKSVIFGLEKPVSVKTTCKKWLLFLRGADEN
ncbi:hypothetical protein LEMLEM_LOCUS15852, partial [Lemmus lemmus]